MPDTSGHTSQTPFAYYDHEACCWRTLQATLVSDLDTFSETWPSSGMTRNGYAYELPMPEHHTADAGYSLLPTVKASNNENQQSEGYGPNLGMVLLPTPTASMMDKDTEDNFIQGSIELGMVKTVSLGLALRSQQTKSQLTARIEQQSNGGNRSQDANTLHHSLTID